MLGKTGPARACDTARRRAAPILEGTLYNTPRPVCAEFTAVGPAATGAAGAAGATRRPVVAGDEPVTPVDGPRLPCHRGRSRPPGQHLDPTRVPQRRRGRAPTRRLGGASRDDGAVIPVVALYVGLGATLLGLAALLRPFPALALAPRTRGAALGLGGLLLAWVAVALPAAEHRVARPRSRLDAFLPRYQFGERHLVHVRAPPGAAYRAVRTVTADEIRGFRTLTWIRRFGRDGPESLLDAPPGVPIVDVATRTGFLALAEDPGRELVYGAPGPVTPAAREHLSRFSRDPSAFRALAEPGFAKLAMNFRVAPDGRGGSVVSTETRVFATDAAARRRMAAYWRAIYPGSALIRRGWLAAIRRRAERER